MLVCLSCISLVANLSYLGGVRSESIQCAQAAALSAGRSLLTDDILKANLQPFEVEARYLRARESARAINILYRSRANIPLLLDHHMTIGTVVETSDAPRSLLNSAIPNHVHVVLNNESDQNFAGQHISHGFAGTSRARIRSQANVHLENRILGFRASRDCPIPFIFLAIADDPTSTATGLWSTDIEGHAGVDRLQWLMSEQTVNRSADRLPEIVVTLHSNQSTSGPGQGRANGLLYT